MSETYAEYCARKDAERAKDMAEINESIRRLEELAATIKKEVTNGQK
jgi:hypothetical protein